MDNAQTPQAIQIRLSLQRPAFQVNVDLTLPGQGITVVYGASGSGKTSLLRAVAGLERPYNAHIKIGDTVWQDDIARAFLPTWQRALGYVFQEASLLPHLNVRDNLRFGLRSAREDLALREAIALLDLAHLEERGAVDLSGGERQRVAIARALATQPQLLLMDEPLASIDVKRRGEVLPWLERLRDELGIPALYVTHSADEVSRLADHLVIMDAGQVKASGDPQQVFADAELASVMGDDAGALISGHVSTLAPQWRMASVAFDGGTLWITDAAQRLRLGESVRLRIGAKDVSINLDAPSQTPRTTIQNVLPATLTACHALPDQAQVLVSLRCGATPLSARITRRAQDTLQLHPGQAVFIQIKSAVLVS